jgi:DNA-binding LacI/PurR family transcriptional regulator
MEKPCAVFCITDETAIRTIGAAEDEGLRVPEDVAVVGYNNFEPAQHLKVPLTTVNNPVFEMGKLAVNRLIRRIRGEVRDGVFQQEVVKSELVIRASCGSALHREDRAYVTKNVTPDVP